MSRQPTAPIPPRLVVPFFAFAWETARDRWRPHTVRRHAIAALWLTACAMRFSELRRLRPGDLSADALVAFIHRSKGGKSGHVEVAAELVDVTLDWRRWSDPEETPWLIPSRTGGQLDCNAFNRDACGFFKREFPGLRLSSHCFRDTACQIAMEQAGQVRTVQRFLGHRSARTTEHYLAKQEASAFCLNFGSGVK